MKNARKDYWNMVVHPSICQMLGLTPIRSESVSSGGSFAPAPSPSGLLEAVAPARAGLKTLQ